MIEAKKPDLEEEMSNSPRVNRENKVEKVIDYKSTIRKAKKPDPEEEKSNPAREARANKAVKKETKASQSTPQLKRAPSPRVVEEVKEVIKVKRGRKKRRKHHPKTNLREDGSIP